MSNLAANTFKTPTTGAPRNSDVAGTLAAFISSRNALNAPGTSAASNEFNEADYQKFKDSILKQIGLRLDDYKPEQMHRRIVSLAQKSGMKSLAQYFILIANQPEQMAIFRDHITINVSELFRNIERFEDLQNKVFPEIVSFAKPTDRFQAWSAGCSIGAEVYSFAIILDELGIRSRTSLRATDIDTTILARAQEGLFHQRDMSQVSEARRSKFFTPKGEHFAVNPSLKTGISFERHDLLAGNYPTGQYDLIACRNVVIYFTDEAKDRVFKKFYDALKPGGFLFVGGTERIADYRDMGFELPYPFFYRKPRS